MRKLTLALLVVALSGCASVTKMDSGEHTIGERLVLHVDGAWNQVNTPSSGPAETWTMEGLPVDQLLVYSGIKDGQVVHSEAGSSGTRKSFAFRASMQAEEVVRMFEGMLTRDGSSFKLVKLEPSEFGGKGFRFEFDMIRKADNVRLSGVGFGSVSKGELFAMLYVAPRLSFFSRHQDRVERMARAARLKI